MDALIDINGYKILRSEIAAVGPIEQLQLEPPQFSIYLKGNSVPIIIDCEEYNWLSDVRHSIIKALEICYTN